VGKLGTRICKKSKENFISLCFYCFYEMKMRQMIGNKKSIQIALIVLVCVIASICLWNSFDFLSGQYEFGGKRLSRTQYKDLMRNLANFEYTAPEAEFVDCIRIDNAKIYRIKNVDKRHLIVYAYAFDGDFAKFKGKVWQLGGGGIGEIIHAELINGQIRVQKVETPIGDGMDYEKSVKEMFPKEIAKKMLRQELWGTDAILDHKNRNEAERYYHAKIAQDGYLDINFDSGKVTVIHP